MAFLEGVEDGGAGLVFVVVHVDSEDVGGHPEGNVSAAVVFGPCLDVGAGRPCAFAAGPPVRGGLFLPVRQRQRGPPAPPVRGGGGRVRAGWWGGVEVGHGHAACAFQSGGGSGRAVGEGGTPGPGWQGQAGCWAG